MTSLLALIIPFRFASARRSLPSNASVRKTNFGHYPISRTGLRVGLISGLRVTVGRAQGRSTRRLDLSGLNLKITPDGLPGLM